MTSKKQEPMRVAQIMGKWLGGGVESVVMNYYRNIDRRKVQFDFICDEDSKYIPRKEIESLGGKIILVPPYQTPFKYHKKLKKILEKGKYKIVHSHISTMSFFSLWAAKSAKVSVRIAHAHSTTNKKEKKKNFMKQILRPLSKVFATDYFCCSELAGRWLYGNKTYNHGRVYLLNNAIDVDKFKYNEEIRNKKRKELNIKKNEIVIGHVGRFVKQKNHEFLIDIFNEIYKQNKNSILLLAGDGPLKIEIENKVKELGLEKNVQFLGQRNDIDELYQAMDAFVLPSLYEGLPVVGVEAQASGLPCFFSANMTEEVNLLDSTKFINLNHTSKYWADKILKEINSFTRKDMSLEITNGNFNIKTEARKLEEYYLKYNKNVLHIVNSKIYSGLEKVACDIITDPNYEYNGIYVTQYGPVVDILKERNINYELIKKVNRKEIKRVIRKYKPDIIHAHDFTVSVISSMCKKDIKLIEHLHNNCPWLKSPGIKSLSFLYAGLRADKILTVSDSIEKEFIFSKFIKNKIICIGNPINIQEIISKTDGLKIQKKYDICCVARLTEQKNPFKFVEIIKELVQENPHIKAVWVGDGELKESITEKIKDEALEDNIELVGFQRNPYIYMAESNVFLLTSDWEGFGLVVVEALTLGLPCVVSNVGGLKEIVDSKCGKLCIHNNDYVTEIKKLLSDINYYEKKSKRALEKSKRLDNITQYINEINKIYKL